MNIIIVTISVHTSVTIIEKLFLTTLRNIEVNITFNSEKYTDKMATCHEAIPKLVFEIFYTKLGWSSRLSDTQEKWQEICQSMRLLQYLWECRRRNEWAMSEASCEVLSRNTAPKACIVYSAKYYGHLHFKHASPEANVITTDFKYFSYRAVAQLHLEKI